MPLPHESIVNRAIRQFAQKEIPSLLDWNHIKVLSQVQEGLIKYEAKGRGMTFEQLLSEAHDSGNLANYMTANGDPRSHRLCHCHAIISGTHPRAAPLRAVMAWVKMRIDFPLNGVWLPCNTAAKIHMPRHLSKAVSHSRIHRNGYYIWLTTFVNQTLIKDDKTLAQALSKAKFHLETGTFPGYVMLRADQLP